MADANKIRNDIFERREEALAALKSRLLTAADGLDEVRVGHITSRMSCEDFAAQLSSLENGIAHAERAVRYAAEKCKQAKK